MEEHQTERQGAIGRMIGFASIIIVLALLGGTAFVFYDYVRRHHAGTWSEREESRERVERDSTMQMKRRFGIGAGIGASIGVLYAVRCLRRREDP